MSRDDTQVRLTNILVEHLGVSEVDVQPDTLLVPEHNWLGAKVSNGRPDLGCDSLDIVELVMAVECDFGLEITDEEAEPLNSATVGEFIDFVHSRRLDEAA